MPRKAAKNVPGTERYRDERRPNSNPKMHGRQWHDLNQPRDLERASMAGSDAVPDVEESGGDRAGMGRSRKTSGTGREKRKRSVPPSKGVKKAAHGSKRGHRASNRGGGR